MNYEQNTDFNNNYNSNMNNMGNNKEPLSYHIKRFLIGFLLILVLIFLLLWLFPTKSGLKDAFNDFADRLDPLYDRIFQENLDTMKEVAISYYTTERLPKKEGDTKKLTLGDMLEMKLLLSIKDKNGETCDLDDSYVELTKLKKEYKMKVNLSCGDEEDYIIVYLGCYNYCLNDICEKKEVAQAATSSGYVSGGTPSNTQNFFKRITNNITRVTKKVVKKTINVIVPDKPSNPDNPDNPPKPEDPIYKYLYKKEVSVDYGREYSDWTDWSNNIEYDPDNNNINWGQHEFDWYEKVGAKTTKITKRVADTSKPIYQNKQVYIGSYSKWACSGYDYFMTSSSSTTYKVVSGWSYQGQITTSTLPSDSNSVKYEFVRMDFKNCGDVCSITPIYTFNKYTRSVTTTTDVSSSKESLTAKCC